MMDVIHKSFLIGDLFYIHTGRDIIIGDTKAGTIPLVSHQNTENGIVKRISPLSNRKLFNHKNTISLADRGMFWATVQQEDFYIGTRVKALTLKNGEKSTETLMYIAASINRLQTIFDEYLVNATDKLPTLKIMLPVNNDTGEIAWSYMHERIAELEHERIAELERYLLVAGLDDYSLNDEDKQIMSEDRFYREFVIEDIFYKIQSTKRKGLDKRTDTRLNPDSIFNLPLVNAKMGNNGIMFYGRKEDFSYENMCIDIIQNGAIATGKVYPQPQDTGVLWDAYLIKVREKEIAINERHLMYLSMSIEKSIREIFDRETKATWDRVKQLKIMLPIKTDVENGPILCEKTYHKDGYIPDWEYMEKYIRVIEKKVIADVVKYKDQVLDVARKVVNG